MMRKLVVLAAVLGAVALIPQAASAEVRFDPQSGTGFAGKGDVQEAFGWNNKDLQTKAGNVSFSATSVSETTWECYNSNNEKTQERRRTTTTQGVVTSVARERNQITGFNLNGYNSSSSETSDGPGENTCPNGPWSYVPDSTQTTQGEGGGLFVSHPDHGSVQIG